MQNFSIQSNPCLNAMAVFSFVLRLKGMQKYLHMQLLLSLMSITHKHQRQNWLPSQCNKQELKDGDTTCWKRTDTEHFLYAFILFQRMK